MDTKQTYAELLTLTKAFLLQEFDRKDWIPSESQTYQYFKQMAAQQRKIAQPPAAPTPQPIVKPIPHAPVMAPPPKPVAAAPVKIEEKIIAPPKHEIPKPKSEPSNSKDNKLVLDPMPASTPHDLQDIRKIVAQKLPNITIIDQIPSYSPEIAICVSSANAQQQSFLKNLARAISAAIAPAAVISTQNLPQDPKLRLVITDQKNEFREGIPCLLLSDISLYLSQPQQKAVLWQQIRQSLT